MKNNVFIAVTGRANAGKSSFTNLLVGEKVAIVSEKPQTTRTGIKGIVTREETQYVFIDTPGMHKAKNRLSEHMIKHIRTSVADVDIAIMIIDATKKISLIEKELAENFKNNKMKAIALINKTDLIKDKGQLLEIILQCQELYEFEEIIPISVKKKDNIDKLFDIFKKYAIEGEHLFSSDMFTDQSERVWLAEIIREKLLRGMYEEVPHGIAVEIESYERTSTNNGKPIIDMGVVIICEKNSHKGMVIGKQGEHLKKIGQAARLEMEEYLSCKVNMKLWVKIKENWRSKDSLIIDLGLSAD